MNRVNVGDSWAGKLSARSGLLGFELHFDPIKLRQEMHALAAIPGAERKAMIRAINRALQGTKTDVADYLNTKLTLKKKDIRSGVFLEKAKWSGLYYGGSVRVSKRGNPLILYDVKPLRQTAMKKRLPARYKHLSYLLEVGGQRHPNKTEDGERTLFVMKGKRGLGVYYRQGQERDKVNQVWGPTLQFYLSPEPTREMILRGADMRFRKELAHQISHLAGGGR